MNNLTKHLVFESGLPRWATNNGTSVNAADNVEKLVHLVVESCIRIIEETNCNQTDIHAELLREAFGIEKTS